LYQNQHQRAKEKIYIRAIQHLYCHFRFLVGNEATCLFARLFIVTQISKMRKLGDKSSAKKVEIKVKVEIISLMHKFKNFKETQLVMLENFPSVHGQDFFLKKRSLRSGKN
jgi:hypothetical protein